MLEPGYNINKMNHDQATAALRQSETRYQSIFKNALEGIFQTTREGKYIAANPALVKMYGYTSFEELVENIDNIGQQLYVDENRRAEFIEQMQEDGQVLHFESRIRRRDGKVLWISENVRSVFDEKGDFLFYEGTVDDITASKELQERQRVTLEALTQAHQRIENELSESEQLAKIAAQVPGVIFQYKLFPDGRSCFPYASKGIREIYGVEPEEVRENAAKVLKKLHPDDFERMTNSIKKSADTLTPWECEYRVKPADKVRWLYGTSKPERLADGSVLWHGYIKDVTERREMEEKAAEAYLLAKTVTDSVSALISYWDKDLRCVFTNDQYEKWFVLKPNEILGLHLKDFLTLEHFAFRKPYIERVLAGEPQSFEGTISHRSDQVHPVIIRYVPDFKDGNVVGFFSVEVDISSVKRAEQALSEFQKQFVSAFEYAPLGMAIASVEPERLPILQVNSSLCILLGYTKEEVLSKSVQELTHPDDWEKERQMMQRLLGGQMPTFTLEKRYIHKTGQSIFAKLSVSLLGGNEGKPIHCIAHIEDITERKLLEEQLRRSQKMEVVGRLAGGVAHDFNNLLTAILLNMQEPPESVAAARLVIEEVRDLASQGAKLTRQLLEFSRQQPMAMKPVEINSEIAKLMKLIDRLIGDSIHVKLLQKEDETWIEADTALLNQALMNIMVNARDAMPQGGTLSVTTSVEEITTPNPRYRQSRAGTFCKVSISDTGTGMTPETLEHLFEPFYTTKEIGKGTGLGLPSADGTIHQHRGWIEVESLCGFGSTFTIYLPVAEPGQAAKQTLPKVKHGKRETILLVEDHPIVQKVTIKVVEKLGYQVLVASDGPEALKLWEEHGPKVSLLLSDVMMPNGMTGLELGIRLRKDRPNLKIILVSGFSSDIIKERGSELPNLRFLSKPYDPDSLARLIRDVLDDVVSDIGRPPTMTG